MALEITELQAKHQFHFSNSLVFEDPALKELVLSTSAPSSDEISLGNVHQKAISTGYMPDCLVKKVSENAGHGLFANEKIKKGSFVGEYTGLICKNDNYLKMGNYLFRYPVKEESGRYLSIDAEPYGNLTRFINHSFEPNLDHHYAFSSNLFHLIFIANRDIEIDEQLFFNYGHSYWYLRGAPDSL